MSASSDYTLTPNLGLFKPIANAAVGLWGDLLNTNADTIDSAIHASTGGGPYLPLAGNAAVFGPATFSSTLTFGTSLIWGAVTATGFGTAIGQVPVFVNLKGSGHPGLLLTDRMVFDMALAKDTDFANVQINRTSTFTSTNTSFQNACLRLVNTIGAHDQTQNYTFQSQCLGNGTDGGVGYAGFVIAQKQAGSTDPVVGFNAGARDFNTGPSSTSGGGVVGTEISTGGAVLDDGVNAAAFGGVGLRIGMHFTGVRTNPTLSPASSTPPAEIAHGIWVGTALSGIVGVGSDPYTYFDSLLGFVLNTQVRIVVDTRGMIAPTGSTDPVSAVTMTAGHVIDFKGSASLTRNPGGAYLQYTTTGGARLRYMVGATERLSFPDAKPVVSGSRGTATVAVLTALLTALNGAGIITDSTAA